jgi:hypothetical protein
VFPFDFSGWSFDWSSLVRVVLAMAIVGSAIGLLVQLVALLRQVASAYARTPTRQH